MTRSQFRLRPPCLRSVLGDSFLSSKHQPVVAYTDCCCVNHQMHSVPVLLPLSLAFDVSRKIFNVARIMRIEAGHAVLSGVQRTNLLAPLPSPDVFRIFSRRPSTTGTTGISMQSTSHTALSHREPYQRSVVSFGGRALLRC